MVTPMIGFYVVTTIDAHGMHTHHVSKDKRCSCGGNAQRPCAHIQAVAQHLRQGGEPAAAVKETQPKLVLQPPTDGNKPPSSAPAAARPSVCVVCGAPTEPWGQLWRCRVGGSAHYWRWRGEQNGVKAFLTQPHPAKQGAFYEQTPAEREAFLAQAHQRMYRDSYSPYGGGH